MKQLRTLTPALLCLLLLGAPLYARETLTLEQCLQQALDSSHRLQAHRMEAAAAQAELKQAEAALWPTLAFSGSYSWVSETMELNMGERIPMVDIPPIEFGDGTTTDLALAANAPLYAGGTKRATIRAREAALEASRFNIATDSLELVKQVREVYYRTLGAQEGLKAAEKSVARLKRHLQTLENTRETGMATREAVLLARSRLQQTQQQVLSAEAGVASARLLLGYLTGRPGEEIQPETGLESPLFESESAEAVTFRNRPDVAALESRSVMLEHSARAVKGSFLPQVTAQAGYHYGRPGVDMVANEWMDYATAGVSLTWLLWDWGGRSQKVEQITAQQRAVKQSRSELERVLTNRYSDARTQWRSAREAQSLARQRVATEQERYSLVQKRYDQGMATETELLDAQDDLALAEIELAMMLSQLRVAEVQVLYATGK